MEGVPDTEAIVESPVLSGAWQQSAAEPRNREGPLSPSRGSACDTKNAKQVPTTSLRRSLLANLFDDFGDVEGYGEPQIEVGTEGLRVFYPFGIEECAILGINGSDTMIEYHGVTCSQPNPKSEIIGFCV